MESIDSLTTRTESLEARVSAHGKEIDSLKTEGAAQRMRSDLLAKTVDEIKDQGTRQDAKLDTLRQDMTSGFNSIQESIFRITGGKAEKFVETWKVALITASAGVLIAAIAKIIISG